MSEKRLDEIDGVNPMANPMAKRPIKTVTTATTNPTTMATNTNVAAATPQVQKSPVNNEAINMGTRPFMDNPMRSRQNKVMFSPEVETSNVPRESAALSFSVVYPNRDSAIAGTEGTVMEGSDESEEDEPPTHDATPTQLDSQQKQSNNQLNTGTVKSQNTANISPPEQSAVPVASPISPTQTVITPPPARIVVGNPDEIEIAGYGWKQSPAMALIWQQRYFVFRKDGSIHYYEDKESFERKGIPKGVIRITDLQRPGSHRSAADSVQIFENKLNLSVNSKNGRVYKLKFGTAEEASKWKKRIDKFIEQFKI